MNFVALTVSCLATLLLGDLAHAHGVGPWGRVLDWHNGQIDQVIAFGGSGRKGRIDGRECLVGSRLNFRVNDEVAFDIDETIWLDIEVQLADAPLELNITHDGDGPRESLFAGASTKIVLPKRTDRQFYRQNIVLERARFANLGFEGTDFSITADEEFTLCDLAIKRSFTTPTASGFGRIVLEVADAASQAVTPARVGIYTTAGRLALPSDEALLLRNSLTGASRVIALAGIGRTLPPWPSQNRSVFYIDGRYSAKLPVGEYELAVAKGPEYRVATQRFVVEANKTRSVRVELRRWRDMAAQGWYSGEDHIHYTRGSSRDDWLLGLFAQAEDIRVSNILQFDNSHTTYLQHHDWKTIVSGDADAPTVLVPGQEAPRTTRLGHTIQLNIKKPIRDTATYLLYHRAFETARAQGGLAGYAHAVGPQFDPETYRVKGMAIDVPLGSVDFAEIMTLHVTGTSIWFDFLNLGFKISPTAGTDYPFGGVPGTVRNYVKLEAPFRSQAWFDALKQGRTFITGGPMLEFSINGQGMGSELYVNSGDLLTIEASASINPDMGGIAALELIEQGELGRSVPADGGLEVRMRHQMHARRGTWFVLRAVGTQPDMIALSAPIYVRVDGQRFWKPEAVPAIVEKMTSQMREIMDPHARETTEAYEAQEDFSKYWEAQKDALQQRVDRATAIYDELLKLASMASPGAASNTGDGTLHIGPMTIPPSDLWSSEFREVYAQMVSASRDAAARQADPHPDRSAPKAEWDAYDARVNAALAGPLARVRSLYPVDFIDTHIAGVHVGIISPKGGVPQENQHRVLINLRGGGFVDHRGLSFGQLESIPVASIGKFKVITVDYRQSPYFQYPAASQDVEAVYRALLKEYKPEAIGIFGCSAGGALTSQVTAWFQKKSLPRPGAIGIFCAELKQAPMPNEKGGDSKIWGLSGIIPESGALPSPNRANRWYMETADRNDPIAYPGLSDAVLARFPPTLFVVGTRESPMSLVAVAHARLLKLRVDSALYLMEGAWHAAHVTAIGTPEAHDANAYIARWFDLHLER